MGYEGFPSTPFQAEKEPAEAFVRATRAEPEKEAAILKAKAEADEEEASLKAEKEVALIVKAGCGSKRKAEEDREVAPTAVGVMVQWNSEDDSEDEFHKACMALADDDYDSDDGMDVCAAKCKASFECCVEACDARYPWLVGKGKVADADTDRYICCGVRS